MLINRKDSLIKTIEIAPINLPMIQTFSISTGHQDQVKNVLIKVTLNNGITGLGEAAPFEAVSGETQESTVSALKHISEKVSGQDILNWKKICWSLRQEIEGSPAALCGMETAIIDSLCRYYHIPAMVLFGGNNDLLKTDMTITISDVEKTLEAGRNIKGKKINSFKVKTAGKDPYHDAERIIKLNELFPDAGIIVDGNCGYNFDSAKTFIEILNKNNVQIKLFEQPLPRENWKESAILNGLCGVKIAADESCRDTKDVCKIIEEKTASVINVKLMKSGVVESIRMIEIAKAYGLELMIGGMVETQLAMTFSAHFAAGSGGFTYADLDTPLFIRDTLFKGGFELAGEIININLSSPGHGVELI